MKSANFFPLAPGPRPWRELPLTPRLGSPVLGTARHPSAAAALGGPVWPRALNGDRHRDLRQMILDLRAVGLEPRRQDQRFAEMSRVLVGREPGSVGRELEQHAARLLEVHRLEPEPIDDLGRVAAGGDDLFANLMLMLVVVNPPGEMVDAADAPDAPRTDRHFANIDHARGLREAVARPAILLAQQHESERAGQKRHGCRDVALPDLRAVKAADLPFRGNRAAVPRCESPGR